MKDYYHRDNCRICESKDLVKFLDFGKMPLAGGFLKEGEITKEKIYPQRVYFCRNCNGVQILDIVSSDILFKDYRFLSSTTKTLMNHFEDYAETMKKKFQLDENSLVVEFGSNDGVLQKPFEERGIKTIGVEPAANVAKIAKEKGLRVINDYFTVDVAKDILKNYGKANLICANNAFAHIDGLHEIMNAIKILLKSDGVFVFEVHYLSNLIKEYQYDMMYHEHLMYYSLMSLSYLLNLFKMEIFDVEEIPIHSGSIKVYSKNIEDKRPIKVSVEKMMKQEKDMKLDKEETFLKFASEIRAKRDKLVKLVKDIKSNGKRIIGYGASGRSTIHLNLCDFGPEEIEYIIDMSPERQNRLTPGTHIPIISDDILEKDKPDYAILFAYNYLKEVLNKEKERFIENGGKFIVPVPDVEVVP